MFSTKYKTYFSLIMQVSSIGASKMGRIIIFYLILFLRENDSCASITASLEQGF